MWKIIVEDSRVLLCINLHTEHGTTTTQRFEIATHSTAPEDLEWYRVMLQHAMRGVTKSDTEMKS